MNTPSSNRDTIPFDDYAPYYEIATDVIKVALEDTKKYLKMKSFNQRKLAELYAFYISPSFKIFSRNMCDFKEHLERRGITRKEIETMEKYYNERKCAKKNVKNGNIIKYKSTGEFYIRISDYLCPIDVKSCTKFVDLIHQISAYGVSIFRQNGDCIWQTKVKENVHTYTSQLNYEQIKTGYTFIIENMDLSDTVWTKQGKYAYIVKIQPRFLFETINDEDIEDIFASGVKYSI